MDPLTCAARAFCQELADGWARDVAVGLVAAREHRGHLLQTLRLFEWSPENRWPLCVVEASGEDLAALASAASEAVLADFAELRRGLAGDGVSLEEPEITTGGSGLERLWQVAERCGESLARTGVVDGLAVVFVPPEPLTGGARRRLAQALAERPVVSHVRLAMATPEASELAGWIPELAELRLDDAELHAYCQAQGERLAAQAPPAEAALRRALLAASDAAQQGDLSAARQAYLHALAGLEAQGREHEAAIVGLALGGICFALGDVQEALENFERAAAEPSGGAAAMGHLGAAGVLYTQGELQAAAHRYEQAAASGGPAALRLEAWWMAGTCHDGSGAPEEAARAWEAAVAVGIESPAEVRGQDSWRRAGEALYAHWSARGMLVRAAELRAVIEREGAA